MDLSLYRGSQILNEGCTTAVEALHNANIAWDQGPLCMESPIWFRFRRTLCILLLHKGALEHPEDQESCHNSFMSYCKTQMTCNWGNWSSWKFHLDEDWRGRWHPSQELVIESLALSVMSLDLNSSNWSLAHSTGKAQLYRIPQMSSPGPLCVCVILPHNLMARGNPANTWSTLIRGNITCTTSLQGAHRFPCKCKETGIALPVVSQEGGMGGWDQHLVACHCYSF